MSSLPLQPDLNHRGELWLIKGDHQFIIRYDLNDPLAAFVELNRMVEDPKLDFDYFDRRVLLKRLIEQSPQKAKNLS